MRSLGGLTALCTFHGGKRGLQWVVSENGDDCLDGDVNGGDRFWGREWRSG